MGNKEAVEVFSPEILQSGQAVQKAQAGFVTAITCQKPRQRTAVLRACEEEATIAGDEFYYSWSVKNNSTGKASLVEGPGVNLILAAARNWGNCGIMVDVNETPETYIFTATFVDLETGYNLQRVFRQAKNKTIGKYKDATRAEDIVFQIGQSKAIRNVGANALPSWLIDKMMKKAKENIIARIQSKGLAKSKEETIKFFAKYNVTVPRIEAKIEKKEKAWDVEDLAKLSGAMKTLFDGQESAEDLFPEVSGKPQTEAPKEKEVKKEKGPESSPFQDMLLSFSKAKEILNNDAKYYEFLKPYKHANEVKTIEQGKAILDKISAYLDEQEGKA